ncbi:MAG: nitrate reductase [Pseudomonadota bacterium]
MTLLDFARGPALQWALIIMIVGILWRLLGALLLMRTKVLSKPRSNALTVAGLRTVFRRSWLYGGLEKVSRFQLVTGYILHVGLFIVILLFVPHIEFFRGLIGFSWPGLPNDVITISAALTVAVLIALLVRRLTHPVLKVISNADDYISWLVTTLPLVTGIMAFAHWGLRYETMLALHLLSVALLMIWIPFGKLMHMLLFIPSRAQLGAKFERRGVRA